ncbi:MAG: aminotransferase class I/II-fold pyridoxal phosphate-dependent enzyme, partial [Nitrosospira sp.]
MSRTPDQVIRTEILALSAYHVPPASGMVKLDAMENPYSLPPELREEIAQLAANAPINRYPDASAASLKATLRGALAVPDGMDILLGNGSDEIIQIIALAFARPGAILMSVEPAFVMFRMIATFTGMGYAGVPLRADFSL